MYQTDWVRVCILTHIQITRHRFGTNISGVTLQSTTKYQQSAGGRREIITIGPAWPLWLKHNNIKHSVSTLGRHITSQPSLTNYNYPGGCGTGNINKTLFSPSVWRLCVLVNWVGPPASPALPDFTQGCSLSWLGGLYVCNYKLKLHSNSQTSSSSTITPKAQS